jgi:hypothetical protein
MMPSRVEGVLADARGGAGGIETSGEGAGLGDGDCAASMIPAATDRIVTDSCGRMRMTQPRHAHEGSGMLYLLES